jgi:hypothetical protein
VFSHVRYRRSLEDLKFYESLYKKTKKEADLRRMSEQHKRLSLLGGVEASKLAHMFKYTVYEKCRSINIGIKLILLVGLFVVCLLSALDTLIYKAYYELAILIFIELGVYVFYIDYIPDLGLAPQAGPDLENSNLSNKDKSVQGKDNQTGELDHNSSSMNLIGDPNGDQPSSCIVNGEVLGLDLQELNRLEFSNDNRLQVPLQYYFQKLEVTLKNLN